MSDQALNIVLLTIDCGRGDHLGAAGASPSPTPRLDQFAEESTLFRQAITPGGWTRPAMMAVFSSVYASYHHGGLLKQLSPELPVFPELLKAHGYQTAGFNTNPVCGKAPGFDRGFDTFEDLVSSRPESQWWKKVRGVKGANRFFFRPLLARQLPHQILGVFGVRTGLPVITASAEELSDRTITWLAEGHQPPRFLWAHYMDLHWPYRLSRREYTPEEAAKSWRDRQVMQGVNRHKGLRKPRQERVERWQTLYREEYQSVDEHIGRILDHLRSSGEWDRTAVIVSADHGEEFYEHGRFGHAFNGLYDEGINVPLIVRVPGLAGGQVVEGQVSTLDLAPTLLELAGIQAPDSMLGSSLLPWLARQGSNPDATLVGRQAYTEMLGHRNSARYRLAIRDQTHKYIYEMEEPHKGQLYDRLADPGEQHNLYAKRDAVSRQYDQARFEHVSTIVPDMLEPGEEDDAFADTDPAMVERLRALGYVE